MKKSTRRFKLIMALVTVAVSLLLFAPGARSDGQGKWLVSMNAIAKELNTLAPYLFDARKFNDPKNEAVLRASIGKIKDRVGSLDFSTHGTSQAHQEFLNDPAFRYFGGRLKEQLESSSDAFDNRQLEFARYTLIRSTSYCISCHTIGKIGNQFATGAFVDGLKSASPRDRIAFLAATRQFDAALAEFSTYVGEVKMKGPGFLQTEKNPIRIALAVAIRAHDEPKEGLAVLSKLSTLPLLPDELTTTIEIWRKSLLAWDSEKPSPGGAAPSLKQAGEILERARKLQRYTFDERGDVEYLRATVVLHSILRAKPDDQTRAQTYLELGDAYQVLQELGLWGLHEFYFESCVRLSPHSKIAETCYSKYSDSVSEGYSGSAGLRLPGPIAKHLGDLKALASVAR